MHMASKPALRAIVYARLSHDPEGDKEGVDRQIDTCTEYAKGQGWEVVDEHTDRNTSAYKVVKRDGYDAAVADLEAGRADILIAWKLDRVHRNMVQFGQLLRTIEATSTRLIAVEDHWDSANEGDWIKGQLLSVFAEQESRNTRTRQKAAAKAKAERGEWQGGPRPYGYQRSTPEGRSKSLVILDDEAKIVRMMAAELLAGTSVNALVGSLRKQGIKTSTGKEWYPYTVIRMFRSPTMAGIRLHHGKVTPGIWPKILDAATHALVIDRLARNSHGKESRSVGLLSGIARCGRCDAPLALGRSKRKNTKGETFLYGRYQCCKSAATPERCGRLGIAQKKTDALVTQLLFTRLDDVTTHHDSDAMDRDAQIADLSQQLEKESAKLTKLADDHYNLEIIPELTYIEVAGNISRSIAAIDSRLQAFRDDVPLIEVEDVRTWWKTATLTERRDLLRQQLSLSIEPSGRTGNVYDPRRVIRGLTWL